MEEIYDPSNKVYKTTNKKGEEKDMSMDGLLKDFKKYGLRVSDLHLKVGEAPCFRLDGKLVRAGAPLDKKTAEYMIFSLLNKKNRDILCEKHEEVDSSYYLGDYQFRINAFHDNDGVAAAIRALPTDIPDVKEVGFPNNVWEDMVERKNGLVLITGITGAGKSTTIAALLQRINAKRACRIITLEDPIEYVFKSKKALISQREIGRDTPSFGTGLRSLLREDPDVVFVGEMRDMASTAWTLTAAETGHLVFSTLHTRDAAGSITRILDYFPAEKQEEVRNQLSMGLAYIVSQKLIPLKEGKGRVVAMEILNNNHAIANLIRTGKTQQLYSVLQSRTRDQADEKMVTMEKSLQNLVNKGLVDAQEAQKWANRATTIEQDVKSLKNIGMI